MKMELLRTNEGPARKKRKAGGDSTKRRDAPPSLPRLQSDCASAVLPFLDLGERARLAATCRGLRDNEREVGNVRSRSERTEELVERVRKEVKLLLKDTSARVSRDSADKAFHAALEEFDSAGVMGAPGLLKLVPMVAPMELQVQNRRGETDDLRRQFWRCDFIPVAVRWLPLLKDAEKIAEKAAAYLKEGGAFPTDMKMLLQPDFMKVDEALVACEQECVEVFKLGLLGSAASAHLGTLLERIIPQPSGHHGTMRGWYFRYRLLSSFFTSYLTISQIAFDSFLRLKSSLTPANADYTLKFLDSFLSKSNSEYTKALSVLLLSNLWGLVQSHPTAQKTLTEVPLTLPDAVSRDPSDDARRTILLRGQCQLVGSAKSTRHLGFLLRAMENAKLCVRNAAEGALRSILPLLSESEREKLMEGLRPSLSGEKSIDVYRNAAELFCYMGDYYGKAIQLK